MISLGLYASSISIILVLSSYFLLRSFTGAVNWSQRNYFVRGEWFMRDTNNKVMIHSGKEGKFMYSASVSY